MESCEPEDSFHFHFDILRAVTTGFVLKYCLNLMSAYLWSNTKTERQLLYLITQCFLPILLLLCLVIISIYGSNKDLVCNTF